MTDNNNEKYTEILPDRKFDMVIYDIKETSQIIGASTRSIMRYIKDGKIKAVKVGGKWKISKSNLEDFMNGKN